jgi:hypothetical protein
VVDLASGSVRAIDGDLSLAFNHLRRAEFSPDKRRLAISHGAGVLVFDLVAGTFESRSGDNPDGLPVLWSPDGRLLELPWRGIIDVTSGSERKALQRLAAFVDSSVGVVGGFPCTFVDVTTGAPVARPLEER